MYIYLVFPLPVKLYCFKTKTVTPPSIFMLGKKTKTFLRREIQELQSLKTEFSISIPFFIYLEKKPIISRFFLLFTQNLKKKNIKK